MRIRVGHLYPDYLNIYADRGNIAVFERRAALRGHEIVVEPIGLEDRLEPGAHDLLYVGGGQDREQLLIAPAARRPTVTRSGMRSQVAQLCSRCAVATSFSVAVIAGATGSSCRVPGFFPTRDRRGCRRG